MTICVRRGIWPQGSNQSDEPDLNRENREKRGNGELRPHVEQCTCLSCWSQRFFRWIRATMTAACKRNAMLLSRYVAGLPSYKFLS